MSDPAEIKRELVIRTERIKLLDSLMSLSTTIMAPEFATPKASTKEKPQRSIEHSAELTE